MEEIGIFENLAVNYGGYIAVVLAIILLADKIAALTPNKTDDKVVGWVRKLFSVIGLRISDVDKYDIKKK